MSEMISVLVLRLEGVLQSWGEHAKWNHRDSAIIPTKSGIIGLLGCALGWERGDNRFSDLARQLTVAVRADRSGRMLYDFHTVSSKNLLTAKGEHRGKNGEYSTLVTNRNYLQDAFFTVLLIGEKELLQKLLNALQKPKWPLYLGRKSCVPSRPVLDGSIREYESVEKAVEDIAFPERADSVVLLEIEKNNSDINGSLLQRPDEYGEGFRTFVTRAVIRKMIQRGNESVSDQIDFGSR